MRLSIILLCNLHAEFANCVQRLSYFVILLGHKILAYDFYNPEASTSADMCLPISTIQKIRLKIVSLFVIGFKGT
jgi:hypothetical protein